jgi:hypothetical protein
MPSSKYFLFILFSIEKFPETKINVWTFLNKIGQCTFFKRPILQIKFPNHIEESLLMLVFFCLEFAEFGALIADSV